MMPKKFTSIIARDAFIQRVRYGHPDAGIVDQDRHVGTLSGSAPDTVRVRDVDLNRDQARSGESFGLAHARIDLGRTLGERLSGERQAQAAVRASHENSCTM
jgi:hypothetical protein